MLAEHERRFDVFGSWAHICVGARVAPGVLEPEFAAISVEALLRKLHAELSRFDPLSSLSALNEDPGEAVAVTPYVAALVDAAIAAATATGGLVDPTLVDALVRSGYASSRVGLEPASLQEALARAPERQAAIPVLPAGWQRISLDRAARIVTRPPGVQMDSGGVGKGLAADLAASRLAGYTSFCVDCGGDLRLGGTLRLPRRVSVEHPLTDGEAASFELDSGAVATSGLRTRLWPRDGGFAHHLIDPGTGRPAWTGVIQATALAPTALQAEVLAKAALLSGPSGARRWLAEHGGVFIHDDGEVERVGAPAPIADAAAVA